MSEIGEDLSELWLTEVLINARQDVCLGAYGHVPHSHTCPNSTPRGACLNLDAVCNGDTALHQTMRKPIIVFHNMIAEWGIIRRKDK